MYKRKTGFTVPFKSAPAALQPAAAPGVGNTSPAKPSDAINLSTGEEKENNAPLKFPVFKKPKLFVPPAPACAQHTQHLSSEKQQPQQGPVPEAAAVAAEEVRTFTVLYTKRDKFKVIVSPLSGGTQDVAQSGLHSTVKHVLFITHVQSCPCLLKSIWSPTQAAQQYIAETGSSGRMRWDCSSIAQNAAHTCLQVTTYRVLSVSNVHLQKKNNRGFQDGVVELRLADKVATLFDMEGKVISKSKLAKLPAELESGTIVELGNFCCEYDKDIPLENYK